MFPISSFVKKRFFFLVCINLGSISSLVSLKSASGTYSKNRSGNYDFFGNFVFIPTLKLILSTTSSFSMSLIFYISISFIFSNSGFLCSFSFCSLKIAFSFSFCSLKIAYSLSFFALAICFFYKKV